MATQRYIRKASPQARHRKDIVDKEREIAHKLFHIAWSAARARPDYNKEAWMHVQQGLIAEDCI